MEKHLPKLLFFLGGLIVGLILMESAPAATFVIFSSLLWYISGLIFGKMLAKNHAQIQMADQAMMQKLSEKDEEIMRTHVNFLKSHLSLLTNLMNSTEERIKQLRESLSHIEKLSQQFQQKLLYSRLPEEIFPIREFKDDLQSFEKSFQELRDVADQLRGKVLD